MSRPRLAFLGSPPFAVPSLHAAHDLCDIPLVLTQPDRPAGRGRKLVPTAVRAAAEECGLEVRTYVPKERKQVVEQLQALDLDVLLVVAFGHILKPSMMQTARCGAVNVHASLLPRWRGSSPVEQAILHGDAQSGVTLMQLDEGVDTGPMIATRPVSLAVDETRLSLLERLATEGATLVRESLLPFLDGTLSAQAQPDEGVAHAPRLEKQQGELDWRQSAVQLDRQVRAFFGWPGCFTMLGDQVLKVHQAQALAEAGAGEPGRVQVDGDQVRVTCGDGSLQLLEVQLPGKRRVAAADATRGGQLSSGLVLGACRSDAP